jgi:hypothetical protein
MSTKLTRKDDTYLGTDDAETVFGLRGDDVVTTYGGDDTVWGQQGDDVVHLGFGNDRGFLGRGNDVADGEAGYDYISAGHGHDHVRLSQDGLVDLGPGDDFGILVRGAGLGGKGHDRIVAVVDEAPGAHADVAIDGGRGRDVVGAAIADDSATSRTEIQFEHGVDEFWFEAYGTFAGLGQFVDVEGLKLFDVDQDGFIGDGGSASMGALQMWSDPAANAVVFQLVDGATGAGEDTVVVFGAPLLSTADIAAADAMF